MKAIDRLMASLKELIGDAELVNFKFFAGSSREITPERLLDEAAKGFHLLNLGFTEKVEKLDSHLQKVDVLKA